MFALLSVVDVHVTGWSTCAFEAMAFGRPTVIVHKTGAKVYRDFINQAKMFYASDGQGLIDAVKKSESVDTDSCIAASTKYLAQEAASKSALLHLLESANN